ncbi:hypothetical protein BRC90_10955 [Halobacteriales archaeon QS_4_69_34]|nr:MAG: hypothetical protein BRC90_10955 [Halobacteriales archaeon QS_4_69_34]
MSVPTDAEECTYCGSDLSFCEPVFVAETADGEHVPAGGFCNYACLSAHIEQAELVYGASCTVEP